MENVLTAIVVVSFIYFLVMILLALVSGERFIPWILAQRRAIQLVFFIPYLPFGFFSFVILLWIAAQPAALYARFFSTQNDMLQTLTVSVIVGLLSLIVLIRVVQQFIKNRYIGKSGIKDALAQLTILAMVLMLLAACGVATKALIALRPN